MGKKSGAGLSFILLAIGAIVLILLFQLAQVLLVDGIENISLFQKSEQPREKKLTGNPFHDIASRHPKRDRDQIKPRPTPTRVPQFTHNPTLGNSQSDVELVIFTDPLCETCRTQINQVIQSINTNHVYVIFKFYPQEGHVVQSGMIEQIAHEKGVWRQWFNKLMTFEPEDETSSLSLDHMASILADVGVDLRQQREMLIKNGPAMSDNLGVDINLGRNLNFDDLPVFYLNNYRLGDQHLPLSQIGTFVARLRAGESIFGG